MNQPLETHYSVFHWQVLIERDVLGCSTMQMSSNTFNYLLWRRKGEDVALAAADINYLSALLAS